MNKYQSRIDILLNEVIDICNNKQIPWFVSGRSAIRSYNGNMYKGGFLDMEVTIPVECVNLFISACHNKKDRYVESLKNNPGFPGFYLKYIDTTSTLINYNEGLACCVRGFFIKINLLRNVTDDSCVVQKAIKYENLIEDTAKTYVNLTGETTVWERAWFKIKKVLIKDYSKRVFSYLVNAYSCIENNRTVMRTSDGKFHYFEKERFDTFDLLKEKDTEIRIPIEPEKFFEECYGDDWKAYASNIVLEGREGDIIYDGSNFLLSLILPYTFFVEKFEKYGINKKFLKIRQRKADGIKREREVAKPVEEAWNIANRAGDLWNVFDYYKDRKERIKKLYDFGEFFALENELEYYDEIVEKYADLNMGFMYDKEMWEIYLYIKKFMSSVEDAERIEKLVENDEKLKIQLRDMEKQLNESFGLYC